MRSGENSASVTDSNRVVARLLRIDVCEQELIDIGESSNVRDLRCMTVSRRLAPAGKSVGVSAFVDEDIDGLQEGDRIFLRIGVADVSDRGAIIHVETKTGGTTRVVQGPRGHGSDWKRDRSGDRDEFQSWLHGKNRPTQQVGFDGRDHFRKCEDTTRLDLPFEKWDQQIRQPADVVEMRVADEDREISGLNLRGNAERTGAGIEGDSQIGEQHPRRVPLLCGMESTRAEKLDFHDPLPVPGSKEPNNDRSIG